MAKDKRPFSEGEELPAEEIKMEVKPQPRKEEIKKEYVIEVITNTAIIASDKQGNGVRFPKDDFINPKVGDRFNA